MSFDFDAAVQAPFRMQPGLRRLAPGATQLTPLGPGSRHQREKLAVLSAFASQALVTREGFDPAPALDRLFTQAATEHPGHWRWDGHAVEAGGTRVADGHVLQIGAGSFGLGDEVARCVALQPPAWRAAALFALSFAEDIAIVQASDTTVPWMSVALPSHWAPELKVGQPFARIHDPVADAELVRRAAEALTRLVTGSDRWERFVWNVTDQPRLHAHPQRAGGPRWQHPPEVDGLPRAWFRTERQTFIPLPDRGQAVFTIAVDVQPLARAVAAPGQAARLAEAVGSMSPAVLDYRGLTPVRDRLVEWLSQR